MKCLDEEKCAKRCIGDFHDEPFVDKIIVIDGGSTDYTVQEIREFDKVEVHIHPWLDWYHDMEVCQSNIALSYVPNGRALLIMDFDERMSPEMKEFLRNANEDRMDEGVAYHFSRRTFELMRFPNSPYAMIGEEGWPLISHQIGQYPDYQCRMFIKDPSFHWINSPHHVICGHTSEETIDADIIHYEKEDCRDRTRLEKKWARNQARRKQLGLPADRFETAVKNEIAKYYDPRTWK